MLLTGISAAEPSADQIDKTMRRCTVSSVVGPMETPLPPSMANFLLDHPDLSAAIVRKHGIAPYRITMRSANESWVDDGDGTSGIIDLTQLSADRRVYYGEGTYRSKIFPSIAADAVIIMDIRHKRREGCQERLDSTFSVYVKLRNPILSGMVKTLRVFLRKTVIRKFTKAFLVADQVGRLLAKTPDAVIADVKEFPLPQKDRDEALRLIAGLKAEPVSCL